MRNTAKSAFTIVELLIVVVVIAILAVITIVAYNGITSQAKDSALKSDLSTTSTKLKLDKVDTGSFPGTKPSYAPASIQYTGGGNSFCITASKDGKAFHMTQDGSIQDGVCAGHTVAGGSGSGGDALAGSMQAFTQSECTALTTYAGSNESAVITLTDNRGDTTRTYQVAKLADNKCWMLDNLKLGSTTGTITLTPTDSNVAANFILPQLVTFRNTNTSTNLGNDYDTPYAYRSVTGDTGVGVTNYGYLYNFPAATAGATRASLPAGNGTAPSSICPANWRLPSGGATGEFAMLNAKMNNPSASAPSTNSGTGYYQNWQNNGPFKGVFSGYWWGSFADQGSSTSLWSRSAHATLADYAHVTYFGVSVVWPNNSSERGYGFAIRCLLN